MAKGTDAYKWSVPAVAFNQVKVRGGVFRPSEWWFFGHHAAHGHSSLPQDTADAQKFVWIHRAMEEKNKKKPPKKPNPKQTKENNKKIAAGLTNAPTHLGWEDLEPQTAGGQESTLQRQHNTLALFGGASLGVCPWLLVEVGEMALQPVPELPSCDLVSCKVLWSSAH